MHYRICVSKLIWLQPAGKPIQPLVHDSGWREMIKMSLLHLYVLALHGSRNKVVKNSLTA
jgi:hypothetical protein